MFARGSETSQYNRAYVASIFQVCVSFLGLDISFSCHGIAKHDLPTSLALVQALTLLEYLLRNGSERSVEDARDHMYQVRSLCDFTHTEPGGVDQGINVREKARQVIDLLNDRERLLDEREKARQNRGKFGGVSSQKMQGFGSGDSLGRKYGGFSSQELRRQQDSYGGGGIGSNGYGNGGIGSNRYGGGANTSGGFDLGGIASGSSYDPQPTLRDPPACAPAPRVATPSDSSKITVNLPGSKTRATRAPGMPRVQLRLGSDKVTSVSGAAVKSGGQDLLGIDDSILVAASPPVAPQPDFFSAATAPPAQNLSDGGPYVEFDTRFDHPAQPSSTDGFGAFDAAPHIGVVGFANDPFTSACPAIPAVSPPKPQPAAVADQFGSFATASSLPPEVFDVKPPRVELSTLPQNPGNFGFTPNPDPFASSTEFLSDGGDLGSHTEGIPAPAMPEPPKPKSPMEVMMEKSMTNITLTDTPASTFSTSPIAPPMGAGSGIGLAGAKASAAATSMGVMIGSNNMGMPNGGMNMSLPMGGMPSGAGMPQSGMHRDMLPGENKLVLAMFQELWYSSHFHRARPVLTPYTHCCVVFWRSLASSFSRLSFTIVFSKLSPLYLQNVCFASCSILPCSMLISLKLTWVHLCVGMGMQPRMQPRMQTQPRMPTSMGMSSQQVLSSPYPPGSCPKIATKTKT